MKLYDALVRNAAETKDTLERYGARIVLNPDDFHIIVRCDVVILQPKTGGLAITIPLSALRVFLPLGESDIPLCHEARDHALHMGPPDAHGRVHIGGTG